MKDSNVLRTDLGGCAIPNIINMLIDEDNILIMGNYSLVFP